MLGKLIKYDLKFILKTVGIYSVILLCCAVLFDVTAYTIECKTVDNATICDNAPVILQILHTIFWNAIYAVIIGLLLNGVIRVWARFKISYFNDEAYLTHTLPVTRKTLWLSKFCSAVLTALIIMSVCGISFAILSLTHNGKILIESFGIIDGLPSSYYAIYLLTVFTQLLFMIICGMTGITIANRMGNNRNIHALIWGFIVYIINILIMLGCFLIWSTFDDGIHAMLFTGASSQTVMVLTGEGFIEKALAGIGVIYAIMITVLYFVDQKLLNRGVDVD